MKGSRFVILIIATLLMFSLQGCSKSWSVDFTTVDDINDWKENNYNSPYIHSLSSDGLFIDGDYLTAPIGFSGDFTLTVTFMLNQVEPMMVSMFEVNLNAGEDFPSTEYIRIQFKSMANGVSTGNYYISETAPYIMLDSGASIPGLRSIGLNVLTFEKKGTHITISMNEGLLCDAYLSSYSPTWYFPIIYVHGAATGRMFINNIKVTYDGETVPLPWF